MSVSYHELVTRINLTCLKTHKKISNSYIWLRRGCVLSREVEPLVGEAVVGVAGVGHCLSVLLRQVHPGQLRETAHHALADVGQTVSERPFFCSKYS